MNGHKHEFQKKVFYFDSLFWKLVVFVILLATFTKMTKCSTVLVVAGTIFFIVFSLSLSILLFYDANQDAKHIWSENSCVLNYISNDTWTDRVSEYSTQNAVITVVNVTFLSGGTIWNYHAHTRCSENINCDWKLGNEYKCWIYHTFPVYPNTITAIQLYAYKDTDPNFNMKNAIGVEIFYGVILLIAGVFCIIAIIVIRFKT